MELRDRPSRIERRILAAAATGFIDFFAREGGDPDAVLDVLALDERQLADPRAPIELADYCGLMERAARETRNGNFGLRFGQQFRPENLGPIGELALASPSLGSALDNLARYFPYHQQVTETRFVCGGEWLRLEYRITDGRIVERRQDAELTMGMFLNVVRRALGVTWRPDEVHFEHPRPVDSDEHHDLFQADVHFGQRTNALVFRRVDLRRPMPATDLARMDRLRRELMRLDGGTGTLPLVERVRGEIRSRLCIGEPVVEDVARTLALGRSTLQRRLAAAGTSFVALVGEMRRSLALRYLQEPHLTVADIASLLGYSETSAFTRAFTRWFSVSPSVARMASDRNLTNILSA